jgi:hypothetical protein
MSSFNQHQIQAAQEFANITIDTLTDEKGVHAGTAIAGAARMAGTFLFRSFDFKIDGIKPGQVVLSENANEQGPRLIQITGAVLTQVGIKLKNEPLSESPNSENQPALAFLETQELLEPGYQEMRSDFGLSLYEAAESAAIASALLIHHFSTVIDSNIAFGIAVYGFIEGAKTAPKPMT